MFEITKRTKLKEVNNEMCHNFYYLINGRLWNDDKTRFYRLKFVEWFDVYDVMDFYERDYYTKQDIEEFVDEIAWCNSNMFSFDKIGWAVEYCNATINDYNN